MILKSTMSFIVLGQLFLNINAIAQNHGGNNDPNEVMTPDSTMISMPIHIGLDGSVSWGLEMSHGGMNHGDMSSGDINHGDMNGGMDHGDMNGGMNHDNMNDEMNSDMDSDMASDTDHDMNSGDSDNSDHSSMGHSDSSWMFGIMPMLHLGYDNYKRVINLSESKDGYFGFDDNSKGYLVVENKSYQFGAGAMIMAMPPADFPFGGYFHAGLMPYKGGHSFKARKVESIIHNNLNLNNMVTPLNIEELSSWAVSDRLSYSTTGGIMFSAGVGVRVFSDLSVGYMAQGTWVTSISKASKKHVLVSIKKSKMKMFMSSLGITIASLQLHKFNNADKNFNFMFDLTKPKAVRAYKDMIQGNLTTAQALNETIVKGSGVKHVSIASSTSNGRMKMRSLGLPILFKKKSMYGQMNSSSYSENYMNNTQMKMEMGMYMRSASDSGIWSAHKDTGFIFMAGSHKMTGEYVGSSNSILGSFKWYFQTDRGSANYIQARFNRAMNVMGVDTLSKINTQDFSSRGPLNFVRGEIDVALTDAFSKKIMKLSTENNLYKEMYNHTFKAMNTYFSNYSNRVKMCPRKVTRIICKKRIFKMTWSAISNLPKAIQNMANFHRKKNEKNFVKAYTRVGQLMLTNRFVFKEIFRAVGEKMPTVNLTLQGSRFSKIKMKL